ncbi:MAG: peptidoglycan DD-metalloendopeptidase family protein [Salinivenus sp.]
MDEDTRYYYDPETCTFVEVEPTWRERLAQVGQIVGLAVLLTGFAIWGIDAYWMTTPEEQSLQAENQALERQLDEVNGQMSELTSRLDTLTERDRRLYRRLFEMEPISDDVRQVGVGGADPHSEFDEMDATARSLLRETAQKLDKLERQVKLQGASYRELSSAATDRTERLKQLPAIRPADGPIVSGYGMRHHPVLEKRKMHSGVDFLLRRGTPVVVSGNGTVKEASQNAAYGTFVDVEHPEAGYITRYAHLSERAEGLHRGRRVERGDTIGYSGNSGRTTGPHLHYEVRTLDGETMDPKPFFVPDMTPEAYRELEQREQEYESRITEEESGADARATR